ncbi:hypothetical protein M405DRAFT_861557 [Rhizopogon salebrosus TDB-379]|nr:hypothetical protein M405DRAFT_861557 [Rhizopogon salebrosus TDB-379]
MANGFTHLSLATQAQGAAVFDSIQTKAISLHGPLLPRFPRYSSIVPKNFPYPAVSIRSITSASIISYRTLPMLFMLTASLITSSPSPNLRTSATRTPLLARRSTNVTTPAPLTSYISGKLCRRFKGSQITPTSTPPPFVDARSTAPSRVNAPKPSEDLFLDMAAWPRTFLHTPASTHFLLQLTTSSITS